MWLVLVSLAIADPAVDTPVAPAAVPLDVAPATIDWHVRARFPSALPVTRLPSGPPASGSDELPDWRARGGSRVAVGISVGVLVVATWVGLLFGTAAGTAAVEGG
jgi:hypothetical protein